MSDQRRKDVSRLMGHHFHIGTTSVTIIQATSTYIYWGQSEAYPIPHDFLNVSGQPERTTELLCNPHATDPASNNPSLFFPNFLAAMDMDKVNSNHKIITQVLNVRPP